MMNNFIANIKAQLGTESSMDDFGVEKYAGSEVAEELLALDDMENISVGVESMTEAVIGLGLMDQEAALESQGLELSDFGRFEGSLGNESLTNMVKRGGYNVVIAVKKAISKLWKFFMAIVDFLTICDGRWKSYSKLAKKYRGKINSLKTHMGEKEEDKTYNIRKVGEAATYVNSVVTTMANFKRTAPTGTGVKDIAENVIKTITDSLDTVAKALNPKGSDATAILGATSNDGAKERLNALKEDLAEKVKEMRESEEKTADDAKSELANALTKLETALKKDVKWFKEFKRMSKDVEKQIEKVGKEDASNVADKDDLLKKLGNLTQVLVEFKKMINVGMKEAGSAIQMVLADAAKLISGETRIGD